MNRTHRLTSFFIRHLEEIRNQISESRFSDALYEMRFANTLYYRGLLTKSDLEYRLDLSLADAKETK